MTTNKSLLTLLFCTLLPQVVSANLGFHASIPLVKKDPPNLNGFLLGGIYNPENLVWRKFHLFFALDFAHWWINSGDNRSTSILALTPVVRYVFNQHYSISPYFEFSIGPAYLSNTHFGSGNLGEHFTFQDRVGVGALVGQAQKISIGFYSLHYSNGSLCSHNSGITIPLMLDIGYRFS